MKKKLTSFTPKRHGFHFANAFENKVIDLKLSKMELFKVTTYGRCGGMAFAALDYFYHQIPIPTHEGRDFLNGRTPHDGSILADYIYDRLFDSFWENWSTYVSWSLDGDDHAPGGLFQGKGVTTTSIEDEYPKFKQFIDQGKPMPLGLVGARSIEDIGKKNHQVVGYGYEDLPQGGFKLYIYDNNHPDQEVYLTYNPSSKKFEYSQNRGVETRGFFVENYTKQRPTYIDLGLSQGVWVQSMFPMLGRPFDCQFNIKNYGQFNARFDKIDFHLFGPGNANLDNTLVCRHLPNNMTLAPGQEVNLFKMCSEFGRSPGAYTLKCYYVNYGEEFDIPALGRGTNNTIQLKTLTDSMPKKVTVKSIKILDDKDAIGAGEIYLRLTVNGMTWQTGLMTIDSGKERALNKLINVNPAVNCVDFKVEVREDDSFWTPTNPFSLRPSDMNKSSEDLGTLSMRFERSQNYGRGEQILKNKCYEIKFTISD